MPEITLENVCKKFDDSVAADNLSLNIRDGEYICILGPTGAGKTTCMRMICGLTVPDSGRILFDGEDITNKDIDLRNATMLSQTYSLFPHMSVYDNVMFAPMIHEWPESTSKQIVRSMMNMVHLEQKADWMPNQLSGGQQQRIALARALASGSKVLLLDEPLRALDARLRINLRKELRSMAKEMGLTCIHVTHDQDEALEMADRIAVIRKGRIIQFDTPKDVFDNPATPFVANFVGRSNVLVGKVRSVGEKTVVEVGPGILMEARSGAVTIDQDVVLTIKVGSTKIRHHDEDTDDAYCTGRIERILYEGVTITVEIMVEGVGIISSKLPNRKFDDYKVGEEVEISWSYDKASVFPMPSNGLEEEMRLD